MRLQSPIDVFTLNLFIFEICNTKQGKLLCSYALSVSSHLVVRCSSLTALNVQEHHRKEGMCFVAQR